MPNEQVVKWQAKLDKDFPYGAIAAWEEPRGAPSVVYPIPRIVVVACVGPDPVVLMPVFSGSDKVLGAWQVTSYADISLKGDPHMVRVSFADMASNGTMTWTAIGDWQLARAMAPERAALIKLAPRGGLAVLHAAMEVLVYSNSLGPAVVFLPPRKGEVPESAALPADPALLRPAYAQVAAKGPELTWAQWCQMLVKSPPYAGTWSVEDVEAECSPQQALAFIRERASAAGMGAIPASDRVAREVATLYEFPMSPERGLNRAQASAAFKKHGLNPRAFGSWVRGGYLAREGDRRWLTSKGREWADSHAGEAELLGCW